MTSICNESFRNICFSNSLSDSVYARYFESDGAHTLAAATCTKIPTTVTVEQKREISLRFLCLINYISPVPVGKNKNDELKLLDAGITKVHYCVLTLIDKGFSDLI